MKFDIMNATCCCLLLVASCAPSQGGKNATVNSQDVLVLQRGPKLESINLASSEGKVLRDSFLYDSNYNVAGRDWKMSPDGSRIAFASFPRDVNFFGAGTWRQYLWTVPFDGKQRVLLAAYGKRADKRDYSFASPSWTADGRKILLARCIVGNYAEAGEIALYGVTSRREMWNSRAITSRIFPKKPGVWSSLSSPALSPNGSRIVCIATELPDSGFSPEMPVGRSAPPTSIVLLNWKKGMGRVLASIDDQFSVPRYRFEGNEQVSEFPVQPFEPQFAWHPSGKGVIFVGPHSPTNSKRDLFALDPETGKVRTLVDDGQDNFSPQWSRDGQWLYWIHGSIKPEKAQNNQIFRGNADGSNATAILERIQGATHIQLLPRLADWGRYRKLGIEPLAGVDK